MSTAISRREFIKNSLSLAGAVTLGRAVDFSKYRSSTLARVDLPHAAAAIGSDENTPAEILKSVLEPLGGISRFVKPGQSVAIKPNATWAFPPHTASCTDPEVLRALIELVKEAGASKITVMDHCSIEPGTAQALKANLLGTVVQETGVEGLFPDRYLAPKGTYVTIDLPEGKAFKKIGVIRAAVEADVRINMAVAKSHSVTRMTLALKHMMGFLEKPSGLHSNLHKGIADLNTKSQIKADLHILEAIYIRTTYGDYVTCAGPETLETNPYVIKRLNQIVAGADPVLVDAYACSTFYGVKPAEFAHLKNAYDWGIGDLDVETAKTNGTFVIAKVSEISAAPTPAKEEAVNAGESARAAVTPQAEARPLPLTVDSGKVDQPAVVTTTCENAVNPGDLLNKALIPASMILAGTGLALTQRKPRPEEKSEDHE